MFARPLEAGITGDTSLIKIEASKVAKLRDDASGKNRANTRNRSEGVRKLTHFVGNGSV